VLRVGSFFLCVYALRLLNQEAPFEVSVYLSHVVLLQVHINDHHLEAQRIDQVLDHAIFRYHLVSSHLRGFVKPVRCFFSMRRVAQPQRLQELEPPPQKIHLQLLLLSWLLLRQEAIRPPAQGPFEMIR
jgi:hypothetical protein